VSPVRWGRLYGAFTAAVSSQGHDRQEGTAMNPERPEPTQQPIIELWRVGAILLVVAAAMMFVRIIQPADAAAKGEHPVVMTSRS
jgi:hypothetical protein